ncbi:DUF6585 family protein [Streptomyces sp. CBMA152]|uniref:DUF6585 family protein n=1 Tax=Streptomyces sp. CBMA152 TaxID=1896312 RepID=UPI0016617F9C|nr:DUF6585 family protein [Streptomyces sp. CBMA152]MBD0742523.1 hypothetical protein [Streptomyces sp. CBMA152]
MGDDQIFQEEPPTAIAALAAERRLGDRVRTFATRQGWTYKKWRDWRLYLHTEGLVVTAPNGFQAAFDWQSTAVVVYRRNVNGGVRDARYTLIPPGGAAVNIGPGAHAMMNRHKEMFGITSLVTGAPFRYPGDWGDYIQRNITKAQLRGVVEAIQYGETVDFGAIQADRHGLRGKKGSAAWADIAELSLHDGRVNFVGADKKDVLNTEYLHYILNADLFLNLCHNLKGRRL